MSDSQRNVVRKRATAWLTEHRRYYEYLDVAVQELERVAEQIVQAWPDHSAEFIEVANLDPAVHQLCRHRDLLGDAVPVFAAMSVESFLNLWGVQLLGESAFMADLERKDVATKFRTLSKHSGAEVASDDEAFRLLRAVMKRRHDLAHPKAREIPDSHDPMDWPHIPLIDRVRSQVADCKAFFARVRTLLPSTVHLLPDKPAA